MKATNTAYDLARSLERIDEILDADNKSFEELDHIPTRDKLTYKNGYYVKCTAIFVDICGSSDMTDAQRRPVLAKIYRSFISEMVAMFNGFSQCKEISINGDCVWAVFDAQYKSDIDMAFDAACKASSLTDILNYKLGKKGYTTIEVNVGMDYGRALMVQAGFKCSAINDVIWMGDVVNSACHLCNEDRGYFEKRILLGSNVYDNLTDDYKKFCSEYDITRGVYSADAYNIAMNNWLKAQK